MLLLCYTVLYDITYRIRKKKRIILLTSTPPGLKNYIIIDKVIEKDVIIKSYFIFCTGYMNYIIVLTDFIVILQ